MQIALFRRKLNSSIKNSNEEFGSQTTISTTNSNRNSRSRIDQDEFEIRRQFRIIKFKGLESRSRTSRSRIEHRNSRSRIEQDDFEIRHEKFKELELDTRIEIRNSRSRIEQDIENFDDKFDTKNQGT